MLQEKLRVNRPLTQNERYEQLKQGVKLGVENNELDDFGSVIKLNGTYLETVDKYYAAKGENTVLFLICFSLFAFFIVMGFVIFDLRSSGTDLFILNILIIVLECIIIYCLVKNLLEEAFTYTHLPIRFNRRNQKVYVFTRKGEVIVTPWQSIFFTKGQVSVRRMHFFSWWDIRGHILDKDSKTVKQSFELALRELTKESTRIYWELIRRYMEEDIQVVNKTVEHCLPISESRQGFVFHFKYIYSRELDVFPFYLVISIFLPFILLRAIGRYLAILTCKVPVWPEWVEKECQLSPTGKLNRTASSNRPWSWRTGWLSKC